MRSVIFIDPAFVQKSRLAYSQAVAEMTQHGVNRHEAAVLMAGNSFNVLRAQDAPKECREAFAALIAEARKAGF